MSGRWTLIDEVGVYTCVWRETCRGAEAEEGGLLFLENQLVSWVEQMTSPCGRGLGKEEPFRET